MVKTLFFGLLIISNLAQANIDYCLSDAKQFVAHEGRPVIPEKDCAELIRTNSKSVKVKSLDGKIAAFGIKHMFYVDKYKMNEQNEKVIELRELNSGDQTGLTDIKLMSLNEKIRKLLVVQKEKNEGSFGLLTFNLDGLGNVTPTRHVKSKNLANVSHVKILDDGEEIVLFSKASKNIRFINAGADTRLKGPEFEPKLIRKIVGEKTKLKSPVDVEATPETIYILDSDRILVFAKTGNPDRAPSKIIDLNHQNTTAIRLGTDDDLIVYKDQTILKKLKLKELK